MLDNLATYLYSTAFIIASLCLAYILNYETQDIPLDIVYPLDPQEQCCMATPEKSDPVMSISKHKQYASDYKHELWPSPRPVNFVRALINSHLLQIEGRITHGRAIEILSTRAQMTPEAFLKIDPITYMNAHMPRFYNTKMLLGPCIQELEYTIRRHHYLDILRRHG
jgi:hypothetical protein